MDILRKMVYEDQVTEKNMRDRDDSYEMWSKTGNESNRSSFQLQLKGDDLSSANAHDPNNKGEYYGF